MGLEVLGLRSQLPVRTREEKLVGEESIQRGDVSSELSGALRLEKSVLP
jgi:hypothetical protein